MTFPSLTEHKPISFGFGNASGLSFADLASKNSGDFAFGSKGELSLSLWYRYMSRFVLPMINLWAPDFYLLLNDVNLCNLCS